MSDRRRKQKEFGIGPYAFSTALLLLFIAYSFIGKKRGHNTLTKKVFEDKFADRRKGVMIFGQSKKKDESKVKKSKIPPRKGILITVFVVFLCLLFLSPFFLSLSVSLRYGSNIYREYEDIPSVHAALVLGAGIYADGSLTGILYDRVSAGVDLYENQKVNKLIMSGDNREENYNEPKAMVREALNLGVQAKDVQPDFAGRRTYDSCWRTKNIFLQDEIIIVTQSFHMERAIFLCESLGIKSYGYVSDVDRYRKSDWLYWSIRDKLALMYSVKDIYIDSPIVVGGDKIDIGE